MRNVPIFVQATLCKLETDWLTVALKAYDIAKKWKIDNDTFSVPFDEATSRMNRYERACTCLCAVYEIEPPIPRLGNVPFTDWIEREVLSYIPRVLERSALLVQGGGINYVRKRENT